MTDLYQLATEFRELDAKLSSAMGTFNVDYKDLIVEYFLFDGYTTDWINRIILKETPSLYVDIFNNVGVLWECYVYNETYSHLTPVSWFISDHFRDGLKMERMEWEAEEEIRKFNEQKEKEKLIEDQEKSLYLELKKKFDS